MRWIRCRKSALDPPSFAGGPRLVCPLAADRFGYRFFGQLFRTLRLAPDGDAMFPGTSGAEHAAREAGRANRSTRRTIMPIPNRSAEPRVGTEWVSTGRTRGWPSHTKKKKTK